MKGKLEIFLMFYLISFFNYVAAARSSIKKETKKSSAENTVTQFSNDAKISKLPSVLLRGHRKLLKQLKFLRLLIELGPNYTFSRHIGGFKSFILFNLLTYFLRKRYKWPILWFRKFL